MALTKRAVDSAKYPYDPDSKRRFVVWDQDVRGFGLRVYPSGRRSFVFRYEIAGRQRWMTLGDYGVLTVQQARNKAEKARVQAREQKDPAEEIRKRRQSVATVGDLAEEFMKTPSADKRAGKQRRARKAKARKPSTVQHYRRLLDKHILPTFGKRRPAEITPEMVNVWVDKMADTPYAANRALWLLSKLMRIAEARGLRRGNPCNGEDVDRYEEHKRQRYLSADELVRLAEALVKLEGTGVTKHAAAAIRLLVFTGARLREVLTLRWEHIDLKRAVAFIPESKTGPKEIILAAPALEVIAGLPRNSEWVIEGPKPGTPLKWMQRPWDRVRKAAEIEDVRLHDLRHTLASWAVSEGSPLLIVGALLGHKQARSTERYAHVRNDPVREAAERVGAAIQGAMQGKAADVVPIESGR